MDDGASLIFVPGCLTKPDLIQPGEESGWLQVLQNKRHRLRHGYFITKQSSQKELLDGDVVGTTDERDDAFFGSLSPWKDCPPELKKRMGSSNLTKHLSELLSELIRTK